MPATPSFLPLGSQLATRKGLEKIADIDPRLTRTHYFDGRLLTAEDLTRDQNYLDRRLREVGLVLGYGVIRGLEVKLDDFSSVLTVTPGTAVSAAGRVLELTRELRLDLGDRALLSELNDGRNQRLDRGLYAIVVRYAEIGTDLAEVFPTDLGEGRGFQYDVISEAVQFGLVHLPQPLAQQNPLHIRANLAKEFMGDGSAGGAVPEDAVALGVLAIQNDRAQWLDRDLLRQPLRANPDQDDVQTDLARHYEALFGDVMAYRASGSLGGDFAATEYFRVLPPVGSLPKGAIDPVSGRQGYFPESFHVWVAPVRKAELALIRQESMVLPVIDLGRDEPLDVIVLAPLSNADYGRFAAQLERPYDPQSGRLAKQDPLRLRLYPKRPVHELDTDAAAWQNIWDAVGESQLLYVRRPLRAAETGISSIVLAQGFALPDGEDLPTPADGDNLLQDEDSVFLNRIGIAQLAAQRPAPNETGQEAQQTLQSEFGADALVVQRCLDCLLRIERVYDSVVWQTLLVLARGERLSDFLAALTQAQETQGTADAVSEIGAGLGLDVELIAAWAALAAPTE
ncbi:MAG TPA: hypothetical protein VNR18_06970 [Hyphomicrobiales bacterium]|nr:hypothetical protein [Hyphomicrobiales bacterium]